VLLDAGPTRWPMKEEMMFQLTERTRRGLAEAILTPGTVGALVVLLLGLVQWLEVAN
jgi:hypothetical protein